MTNANPITDTPSITKQDVFRPEMARVVSMEDVNYAKSALFAALLKRDLHFSSVEEDDKFHDSLSLFLEESFNWPDYNNFN